MNREYELYDHHAGRETVRVLSSHGEFTVARDTGHVLTFIKYPEGDDMSDVLTFDFIEWERCHGVDRKSCDSFDILDVGYWYTNGHEDGYVEPDEAFRKEISPRA